MTIRFEYDSEKAVHVVLALLSLNSGKLTKLKLIKLIFFADREHLYKYGRPIIGGSYRAMPHGPVLSELYTDICDAAEFDDDQEYDVTENNITSTQQCNHEYLSKSDIEILEQISEKYKNLTGIQLRVISHQLKAYKNNWQDNHVSRSFNLPYDSFFDDIEDRSMLDLIYDNQVAKQTLEL